MNNKFEQYNINKAQVLKALETAIKFSDEYKIQDLKESFIALKKQTEEGEFTIVVVGEFSSGKSTFLNALMGERYLPSATKETTATVNFLKHISQSPDGSSIVIYYTDGNVERISGAPDLEKINKYVSTEGDNVAKYIERVEIFLDSPFLENNVTLVDSPGLNGVADGHHDITMQQIAKSHACIFMFDSGQPGKATDFDFLRKIKEKTNNLFFLLNQIDKIREDEGETVDSVIEILKANYNDEFKGDKIPEIYGVSAIKALVSRSSSAMKFEGRSDYNELERRELLDHSLIENFETRLIRFLTQGEKTYSQLLEPLHRIDSELKSNKQKLKEQEDNLGDKKDSQELDEKLVEIQKEHEQLKIKLEKERKTISQSIVREKRTSIAEFRKVKKSLVTKFDNESNLFFENIEDILTSDTLDDELYRFQNKVKNKITQSVDDIQSAFVEAVEIIAFDLEQDITSSIKEKQLSIEIKRGKIEADISDFDAEETPSYDEGDHEVFELEMKKFKAEQDKADIKSQRDEKYFNVKRLQREKRARQEDKNHFDPENEYYEDVIERRWRTGGGGLANIFGLKDHKYNKRFVQKNQHYIDFEANRDRDLKEIGSELKRLQDELEDLNKQNSEIKDVSQHEIDREQKKHERTREREKIKNEKEHKIKLRKLKSKVKMDVDQIVSASMKEAKSQFENNIEENTSYFNELIIGEINKELGVKIALRTKEIENLQSQKELSETGKNTQLNLISKQLDSQKEVMLSVSDVITTLEMASQNFDKVEYKNYEYNGR